MDATLIELSQFGLVSEHVQVWGGRTVWIMAGGVTE